MNNSEDFISKYLTKPNKTGDGYKLYAIHHEAETTSDLDELSALQNHKDSSVRSNAAQNPNCTPAHIDKALNDESDNVRANAAANPNATSSHLDRAINDDHRYVRSSAARNPNATKEHLDKAFGDEYSVRQAAASNPNCTKEHLAKALGDDHYYINVTATKNPNYKKFFPNGH